MTKTGLGRTCSRGHLVAGDNAYPSGSRFHCHVCLVARHEAARVKLKADVIVGYGGACACCGETEPDFLCLDHVRGGGNRQRRVWREAGKDSSQTWRDARRRGYPDEYRLLCWNCNHGVTRPGGCPHTREAIVA